MTLFASFLSVGCLLLSPSLAETSAGTNRPPFLSHVTKDDLMGALETARQRHHAAVEDALSNYPIDTSLPADSDILEAIELKQYEIQAPGSLPDFAKELPRHVFVTETPLLSADECNQVIANAEAHFRETNDGEWTQLPSGQYLVGGFWIKDIPAVHEWFCRVVRQRLFPLLAQTFPSFCTSADDLCVDNAYLFKYTPETGRRTDVHTDSGCLSFTIALNPSSEYEGGGTWFDGIRMGNDDGEESGDGGVIEMDQGQVTIRPGGVKHCGNAVESGMRYIIGGFCMHRNKPEHVRQLLAPPPTVDTLEAAIAVNPQFDSSYNLLANAYEQAGKSAEARQAVLEHCLEHVHPYSGDVAYALGSLYYKEQGLLDKAKACFAKCLIADKYDVEAMSSLMMLAADQKDAEAETVFAQRILDTPSATSVALAQAYCNLGVLQAEKDSDKEIYYYQKSLEHEPNRFAPRYSLACAYASRQEWKLATAEFRRAIDDKASLATPEEKEQALKQLYVAAMRQIQAESAGLTTPPSREDMMQKFGQLMGEANFQQLMKSQQQR